MRRTPFSTGVTGLVCIAIGFALGLAVMQAQTPASGLAGRSNLAAVLL